MTYENEELKDDINSFIKKNESSSAKLLQIATDATRILSTVGNGLTEVKNSGFFERISEGFNAIFGNRPSLRNELANTQNQLDELKRFSLQTLEVLSERNLLTADALITVKNNLNSVVVEQNNIKDAIKELATRSAQRFAALENRIARVESSQNLETWVANLQFDKSYKNLDPAIRFLKVTKGFYINKQGSYTMNEINSFNRALSFVDLSPEKTVTLEQFIDGLIVGSQKISEIEYDEITKVEIGDGKVLSAEEIADTLAVPSFVAVTTLSERKKALEAPVKLLANQDSWTGSVENALQVVLKDDIKKKNNIELGTETTLFDLGIELISCYSALPELIKNGAKGSSNIKMNFSKFCGFCGKQIDGAAWCGFCGKKQVRG